LDCSCQVGFVFEGGNCVVPIIPDSANSSLSDNSTLCSSGEYFFQWSNVNTTGTFKGGDYFEDIDFQGDDIDALRDELAQSDLGPGFAALDDELMGTSSADIPDLVCPFNYVAPGLEQDGKCVSCPPGTLKTETGNSIVLCLPCPVGMVGLADGSGCGCQAGAFLNSSGQCAACEAGSYMPSAGNATSCSPCPANAVVEAGDSCRSDCTCPSGFKFLNFVCEQLTSSSVVSDSLILPTAIHVAFHPADTMPAVQVTAKVGDLVMPEFGSVVRAQGTEFSDRLNEVESASISGHKAEFKLTTMNTTKVVEVAEIADTQALLPVKSGVVAPFFSNSGLSVDSINEISMSSLAVGSLKASLSNDRSEAGLYVPPIIVSTKLALNTLEAGPVAAIGFDDNDDSDRCSAGQYLFLEFADEMDDFAALSDFQGVFHETENSVGCLAPPRPSPPSPDQHGRCVDCPLGTFKPNKGDALSLCIPCPTGLWPLADSSGCGCQAGAVMSKEGTCVACAAGKFKEGVGNSSLCSECPANAVVVPGERCRAECRCQLGHDFLDTLCVPSSASSHKHDLSRRLRETSPPKRFLSGGTGAAGPSRDRTLQNRPTFI
jgi:hypothetical protein